jgi:ketopantoate reductase
LLTRERYLLGYADAGGTIRDGVYWVNLGAEIHFGEVDGKPTRKLEKVKDLFVKADMKPDIQENIVHWLWQHAASAIGVTSKHSSMTKNWFASVFHPPRNFIGCVPYAVWI